jgi:hypothetical protein
MTTQLFIDELRTYSAEIGIKPEVGLAVMLFETGGSLSAWYKSSDSSEAFGILQWTKGGAEPAPVQKAVGIINPTEATRTDAYEKLKLLNRREQLKAWKAYYLHWYKLKESTWANISDPYLKHYVLTLAPNGGPNYRDGNGVSAAIITQGTGPQGQNFTACKKLAGQMLSGEKEIPNEDEKAQEVIGPKALGNYLTKVGTTKISQTPSITNPAAGAVNTNASDKKKTLEDLLPVKISFSIIEYPRLIGLKAGDVIVLPPSSQLRDWLITKVERNFSNGFNTLQISGNRPLDPKPFVQTEALANGPTDFLKHYWG